MKKLTLAVLVIVLAAAATYFSVGHYNKYQNQQKQTQQAQVDREQELGNELSKTVAQNKRLTAQYQVTRAECEKGIAAYAQLTATQKKTLQAPTSCGPEQVQ